MSLLPKIENIKPINPNEVLVVLKPRHSVEGARSIFLQEDVQESSQYYEILKCGSAVTQVSVGDVIFMSWKKVTPPIKGTLGGQQKEFGFASVFEIDAIISLTE